MLELTVRLVASLAVVVGLLLLLARMVGKRFDGRQGAPVQVLHRQALSRSASVAVVSVGSRVLVLGTTDQQVQLLTEVDPEDLAVGLTLADDLPGEVLELPTHITADVPVPTLAGSRPGSHRAAPSRRTPQQGALAGSVLSASTWRQAVSALTGTGSKAS